MSKYLTYADVAFKDRALLVQALQAMGYTVETSSVFGKGLKLNGYQGQTAECELVIRRNQDHRTRMNLPYYGDIGFTRTNEGYALTIDESDQHMIRRGQFVRDLKVEYNTLVAATIAKRLNGSTQVKTEGQLVKYAIAF